jgi:hypothetical protein
LSVCKETERVALSCLLFLDNSTELLLIVWHLWALARVWSHIAKVAFVIHLCALAVWTDHLAL